MIKIAIVGCTGELGSAIMKNTSELIGGKSDLMIIDDIKAADNCDIYIDCTNAETFMRSSYSKYERMQKPLIIATTAFSKEDIEKIHLYQKKDAPSGTALMIKEALLSVNKTINRDKVSICSIRGGNIFGEHEVIFANCKDEVVTFKHQVSSRETFADGVLEVSKWILSQTNGLYNMDDFCNA